MSRRKAFIFGLAAYFVVYIGLLVPGHLSRFASDYSRIPQGYQQAHAECQHHNPNACQICLSGGHVSAVGTTYCVDLNFDLVTPVVFAASARIDCFHIDRISARAPPSLV